MATVLRSMLYIPANSWRMISNATTEGADAVILDLEDACPMAEKETGRVFARDALPMIREQGIGAFVRVNALETGLIRDDLRYVVTRDLHGIILAKTESAEDIVKVHERLSEEEDAKGLEANRVSMIPLVETPRGIVNLAGIIAASSRILAVAFGAGDFSREMGAGMGVTRIPPEEYFSMTLYARSHMAITARAAGVQAIDTPFFGLVIDLEGLRKETERVRMLGFSGKQLTHPRHVAQVNEAFTPDRGELDFAARVVEAYEAAKEKGLGATTLGGKMIDLSSYKRACALLAYARAIQERERGAARCPESGRAT